MGEKASKPLKTTLERPEDALGDAVRQLTAIQEVVATMGAAPIDLQPTLEAVARNAVVICRAEDATVLIREGDLLVPTAHSGPLPGTLAQLPLDRGSASGRAVLDARTVHVPDLVAVADQFPTVALPAPRDGVRALLSAPLLRGQNAIGAITLRRQEPIPFTDRQIDLLETFARQAAIAIENVRLFTQTKEALDRQGALSEVLKVISQTSTDPTPVFQAVVDRAAQLCEADTASLLRRDGVAFAVAAHWPADLPSEQRGGPTGTSSLGRGSVTGRVLLERHTVQIKDAQLDAEYDKEQISRGSPGRTLLGVPLLRDGEIAGVILLRRREMRPFTASEITLIEAFADQAVIAIENAGSRATVERQRAELRRFLSPQVADLITSPEGQTLLAGHRREITVVFCDLRGFTAFSETAEPEEALAVVRLFHETLGPLVFEHGGTLEHFEGDGAMVFFNDPVPVEDHVLRAVRMTLAIREVMAQHVAGWRKRGHELGFGCGIATGYATLGRIGFEGRYDYGAIGPVTNLAARLGSEAKAGQILISQRAFAQVEERVEVEPIGELSVKGYSRPQAAYNVVRLKQLIHA